MDVSTVQEDVFRRLEADETVFPEIESFIAANLRKKPLAVLPVLSRVQEICRTHGYRSALASTLFWFGWYRHDRGDFERALELHFESLTMCHDLQEKRLAIRATHAISTDFKNLGLYDIALDWAFNARREAEAQGATKSLGAILLCLGDLLLKFGKTLEAAENIERAKSLELSEDVSISFLAMESELMFAQNNLPRALELADSALGLAASAGIQNMKANSGALRAKYLFALGRIAEASAAVTESIDIIRGFRDFRLLAEFLIIKGRIDRERGDPEAARASFREALKRAESGKMRPLIGEAAWELAALYEEEGKYALALRTFRRFNEVEGKMSSARSEFATAFLRSEIMAREAESSRKRYKRIETIGELGCDLTGCLDLDRILESVYGKVNAILDANTFGIALHDPHSRTLRYELFIENGKRTPVAKPVSIHDKESLGAWCFANKAEVIIGDVREEYSRFIQAVKTFGDPASRALSIIYVPLLSGKRIIGVVTAQSYRANAYDSEEIEAFRILARYVGIALENGILYEEMKSRATVDQLTGLLNRRGLFRAGERELKRVRRHSGPLSVIMLDLDYFKNTNDRWGHTCGDEVLRRLGRLIENCLRASDFAGRYGGDEFIIVMPETTLPGGIIVIERIRTLLKDMVIEAPDGMAVKTTASFGIVELDPDKPELKFDDLATTADEALYEAKRAGRDRMIAAHKTPTQ